MITLYLMTKLEASYETLCFNKIYMTEKVMCTYIHTLVRYRYKFTFGKMVMVFWEQTPMHLWDYLEKVWGRCRKERN